MIVVDTSAWIEWLIGSALGKRIADELPDRQDWLVPTIVQLELAKWLTREGIKNLPEYGGPSRREDEPGPPAA